MQHAKKPRSNPLTGAEAGLESHFNNFRHTVPISGRNLRQVMLSLPRKPNQPIRNQRIQVGEFS